jgi:NAD(P)-dependent dehydrogenase (short-subunit alcohol dehydrogenase family)
MHLQSVIDKASRVDISFNAIGIPNRTILGVPLTELDAEQFSLPLTAYTTSYFLTARLAARHMLPNKSGMIMTVTAIHSRIGIPLVGGYGPAQAVASGMTWQQWQELLASRTHPRRLMTLDELASTAAFIASDKASGMTGTTVNLTMGSLDD